MKKFIILSLAGVLIFALGATVYAQAPKLEFKVSGYIDAQTFWTMNVPPRYTSAGLYGVTYPGSRFYPPGSGALTGYKTGSYNKEVAFWDSRAVLKMDMVMGPNLSGTIMFEIDTSRGGSTWSPYLGNGREANTVGGWSADRTAVEVKNIYIDFGLPYFGIPVPMTVRVGAQPIGVRPNMLVYTDGFGVTGGIKIDPVLIIPIYAKPLEGLDFAADDCDVYGLHVNAKLGTFTVGGYGLWYNMNTYPFFVNAPVAGLPTPLTPVVQGTYQASMYWLGVYADGKAGPVNINFDFVYDFGKVESKLGLPYPKVDYQGWAIRTKIDFPWEKFNFGVVGMYASGSDAQDTSTGGLPGQLVGWGTGGAAAAGPYWGNRYSKKVTGYVVPPGSEQDTNNYESIVVYGMESGASGGIGIAENTNYSQVSKGAFGGTWFAKLYGSAKLTPWYKVTLQGLYIGDTTTHGNTFGSAVKYPGTSYPYLKDNGSIGWELDLINEIYIYRNLRWFIGGGVLWAGSALDVSRNVNTTANPIYLNARPSTPWAIRTRLVYTF